MTPLLQALRLGRRNHYRPFHVACQLINFEVRASDSPKNLQRLLTPWSSPYFLLLPSQTGQFGDGDVCRGLWSRYSPVRDNVSRFH